MAATVLAIEGATRLRLSSSMEVRLPHVGVTAEAQRRLEWVERSRERREEAWPLDEPDALLGWRPRPGVQVRRVRPGSYDVTVTTNAQALRGPRGVARERTPGVTRVAVFGCSQTFGSGVEDDATFGARLEAGLPGVEVLNFGVHGYGTDQMLLRWEGEGAAFAPDVVVLAFAYYHLDRNITGFRFFAKPRFVLEPDRTLRLIGVPVPTPQALMRDGVPVAPWPLADRSMLLRWLSGRVLSRRETALYRPEGPAWELTRALIARFAATARRQGARMILLNIDEDVPSFAEPLARLADDLGIEWADAGPALGAPRAQGIRLRLPHDPHWSAAGHAVIAEVLRTRFCAGSPLPGCAPRHP